MEFEFDPNKSASNKIKHGVDFIEGQQLWDDPYRAEFDTVNLTEKRILTVGRIGDKVWTAISTYRNNRIRIISIRRSRQKEKDFYVRTIN